MCRAPASVAVTKVRSSASFADGVAGGVDDRMQEML